MGSQEAEFLQAVFLFIAGSVVCGFGVPESEELVKQSLGPGKVCKTSLWAFLSLHPLSFPDVRLLNMLHFCGYV